MKALNPSNKIPYKNGDKVEIIPSGRIENGIYRGTILGPASQPNIIDYWIVGLDEQIPDYPWDAVSIGHIFIRPQGTNQKFLCEE